MIANNMQLNTLQYYHCVNIITDLHERSVKINENFHLNLNQAHCQKPTLTDNHLLKFKVPNSYQSIKFPTTQGVTFLCIIINLIQKAIQKFKKDVNSAVQIRGISTTKFPQRDIQFLSKTKHGYITEALISIGWLPQMVLPLSKTRETRLSLLFVINASVTGANPQRVAKHLPLS